MGPPASDMISPKKSETDYRKHLDRLKKDSGGFYIFAEPLCETGTHPENFVDYECAFAAFHIHQARPANILDVGSYRHFILGLLAHFPVTTIDVRGRKPLAANETVLTCDAKKINLPDSSFDFILSLCALEHFGLGRYGDEFDRQADQKALAEMIRVLKPGGRLLFTTSIHNAEPAIAFNAHRIYNHDMIRGLCTRLKCLEEKFYSHQIKNYCSRNKITTDRKGWDVYCGCWEKK